jgi:aldose sugar dehydrogenase
MKLLHPMSTHTYRTILATLVAICSHSLSRAEEGNSGEMLYQKNCAACHGSQLEGGNAQSLVDAVWQFGAGRGAIRSNIKYGIADFSMPAFELALTDEQINDVITFLLDSEKDSGATKPPPPERIHTLDYEVRVEVLASGLDTPWGITFLAANHALVTERSGTLRQIIDGVLAPKPVEGTPLALVEGQGGLLDVAADPEYAKNGWVYLSYSHSRPDTGGTNRPGAMTRIVRGRIRDGKWTDQQVIYEAPGALYVETRHHYGSRIVFDREGLLYFSIGERGLAPQAQDLSRPNGKVHRIHRDGSIPIDNPFRGRTDALPTLFTYGNRNPQGLAVHPDTGQVWETEHGPMGGDELNLVIAGKNYGWPEVTYGRNYDGAMISETPEKQGMESPRLYWKPSIAVCGIDFMRGSLFPRWRNHLVVGALKYEEIRLLDIKGDRVLHQEILLKNAGRVRDVACGPDGALYAVMNGPGMVLRLTPIRDLNETP